MPRSLPGHPFHHHHHHHHQPNRIPSAAHSARLLRPLVPLRAPPGNFTAFIWPDEWLAALSVPPLPAISSRFLFSSPHLLYLNIPNPPELTGSKLQVGSLLPAADVSEMEELHSAVTILHVRFKGSAPDLKTTGGGNNAAIVAAPQKRKLHKHTHTGAYTHVSEQIHHLYFFPNVLVFFLRLHRARKNIYFC